MPKLKHSKEKMVSPRRNSETNLIQFFKKRQALLILSIILFLLTWLCFSLQRSFSSSPSVNGKWSKEDDEKANLVRFDAGSLISPIIKDNRGWLLNPVSLSLDFDIKGGAVSCVSTHVGEIRSGSTRGNHRHHTCNETFVIWGAKTLFRLEKKDEIDKGFAEVITGADEIAVAGSPASTAHALVNVDPIRSTYFIACQDSIIDYKSSTTDFSVWNDL